MAISIAAGVAFATVLTLVLIPSLMVILNDFRLLAHKFRYGTWPRRVAVEPAIDRKVGFAEVTKGSSFKIIKSQSGDFTRAKGKEVMEAFLKSEGKKIDVLYAHNDDMALGAIQAIEAYGLKPGKDIIIVSIDAVRGAFEAMLEGKINCTVECSPLLGPQLFDAVEDLIAGKELPKRIVTNEGVFPAEVAAEALPSRKY
jgi:simple sugar transport system substrate-binding protein